VHLPHRQALPLHGASNQLGGSSFVSMALPEHCYGLELLGAAAVQAQDTEPEG
jgi:hypothetical protein